MVIKMRIDTLRINIFRKFKDQELKIGQRLTCISGHNGVGKSTILGMLVHTSEMKMATGKTINKKQFRAEFGDLFKFSPNFDKTGSSLYEVSFEELPGFKDSSDFDYSPKIKYRGTWQKGERFRLIPMKEASRRTERKVEWPVFYLGLSRLFPIGESENFSTNVISGLSTEEEQFIMEKHKNILSIDDEYEEIHTHMLSGIKSGFGVKTGTYDSTANSSGQDNLGQILLTLVSFKRLKNKMADKWIGGMFVIDEIDATLHPAAQNRLIDLLYSFSEMNNVQIVFTSHSVTLIEHLYKKYQNSIDENALKNNPSPHKVEIIYIHYGYGEILLERNSNSDLIEKSLLSVYRADRGVNIFIYSEDNEARWFFDKLFLYFQHENIITSSPNNFSHIKVNLGNDQLLKLLNEDVLHFSNQIILLDGDVKDEDILQKIHANKGIYYKNSKFTNILKIPGTVSPEQLLYDYLVSLDSSHDYFRLTGDMSFTKDSIVNVGPFSSEYNMYTKNRDKYKKWFNDNQFLINELIKFWIVENKLAVKDFLLDLERIHNVIAKRNNFDRFIYDSEKVKELLGS